MKPSIKAEKEQEARQAFLDKGICPDCRRNPLEDGKKRCTDCLGKKAGGQGRRDAGKREEMRQKACRLTAGALVEVLTLLLGNRRLMEHNDRMADWCRDFRAQLEEELPATWTDVFPPQTERLTYPTAWPWRRLYGRRKNDWAARLPQEWRDGWLRELCIKSELLVIIGGDRPKWPLRLLGLKDWDAPLDDVYALTFAFCHFTLGWMAERGHEPELSRKVLDTLDSSGFLLKAHVEEDQLLEWLHDEADTAKDLSDWLEGHRAALVYEWARLYDEADDLESVAAKLTMTKRRMAKLTVWHRWGREADEVSLFAGPLRPERLQDSIVKC